MTQGLVLMAAWGELAALVGVLVFWLSRPGDR
jgi:hypothetical protein